ALRPRPANRIGDYPLDEWIVVNRISLVARAEIKDPATAAEPAIPATEHFSTLEPGNEHLLVGGRNSKRFSVTFGVLQLDEAIDTPSYRMARVDHPDALPLARFAPSEVAACSH